MRRRQGAWYTIIPFMMERDPEQFFEYLRMTPDTFSELLAIVRPYLQRRRVDAYLCPGERLALTLRYVDSSR